MRKAIKIGIVVGIGVPIILFAGASVMNQLCAMPTPSSEWNDKLNTLCHLFTFLSQLIETATHFV